VSSLPLSEYCGVSQEYGIDASVGFGTKKNIDCDIFENKNIYFGDVVVEKEDCSRRICVPENSCISHICNALEVESVRDQCQIVYSFEFGDKDNEIVRVLDIENISSDSVLTHIPLNLGIYKDDSFLVSEYVKLFDIESDVLEEEYGEHSYCPPRQLGEIFGPIDKKICVWLVELGLVRKKIEYQYIMVCLIHVLLFLRILIT